MYNIQLTKILETKNTNCGTFLQTPFWCNFKQAHGWLYNRFLITYTLPPLNAQNDSKLEDCKNSNNTQSSLTKQMEIAVLNRSFCKNYFSIAYIPLMPQLLYKCTDAKLLEVAFENSKTIKEEIITPETQIIEFTIFLKELSNALKQYLPKNTIVIRYDPDIVFTQIEERDIFNFGIKQVCKTEKIGLHKNSVDIQPPDSSVLDLTQTEEELLQNMHSKWRYNIRLAEKKGVVIKKYFGDDKDINQKIELFYALTKETNARDGNSSHAKSYYLDLITRSINTDTKTEPKITLYIAEHEKEEIASIMTLFNNDQAIYLYGASSNKKRNLMPNHLLQWTAIKDAKAYGSKIYDFYGMSPEGKNENHPMHGLYMFKSNFGGQEIHRIGSWDFPTKKIYYTYNFLECLRAFWYKKIVKKLKGR